MPCDARAMPRTVGTNDSAALLRKRSIVQFLAAGLFPLGIHLGMGSDVVMGRLTGAVGKYIQRGLKLYRLPTRLGWGLYGTVGKDMQNGFKFIRPSTGGGWGGYRADRNYLESSWKLYRAPARGGLV